MVGRKIILAICLMLVSTSIWAQKEINTEDFKKYVWDFQANPRSVVLKSNVPVILDFYATWCRPCKMLTPELIALQKEYEGKLIIYKIDVDKDKEIARLFGVTAMPTLYFLPLKGNVTYTQGYTTKDQLKEIVDIYFYNKK